MSKSELRLFLTSFSLTLLFFGFIAAFLLVDANSSRRERGSVDTVLSVSEIAPAYYRLTVLGWDFGVSLEPLRQLDQKRIQYAPLVGSRTTYLLRGVYDYSHYWGNELYDQYKERVYQQEVGSFSGQKLPPYTEPGK